MKNKRVLVISHTLDFQRVTQLSLSMAQWQVLTASSLQEGLTVADTAPLDVVLLNEDILEPEQVAVLETLQTNPTTQNIPIVAMVGMARSAERQHLCSLGVKAVLPQWINPVVLAQQIADALGWSCSLSS